MDPLAKFVHAPVYWVTREPYQDLEAAAKLPQ